MLESVVGGPWKHKVRPTELFDEPQPLHLRSIDNPDEEWIHLKVSMDWVIENLQKHGKILAYLTNNIPDTTITIPGYVLSHQQDRPSRGGGIVVYSRDGVALRVLNVDSRPHEVSWLQ
eukprot:g31163.t1